MKKIVEDPIDILNHDALLQMYTQWNTEDENQLTCAQADIEHYCQQLAQQNSLTAPLEAQSVLDRLKTDKHFEKQMVEAFIQHNAVISCFFYDKNSCFYDDFLYPYLSKQIKKDFEDTRKYRLFKLTTLSFEAIIEDCAMQLSDEAIDHALIKVQQLMRLLTQ